MSELERQILHCLQTLVPSAQHFDFHAIVNDRSSSVEFFSTIDGQRYQCYDMIDNNMLNEAAFDKTRKDILQYIRTSACYKKREFNTVKFSLDVLKNSCL